MTKVFNKETFRSFYDRDAAGVFSDLEFRACTFISSRISVTRNPLLRSRVMNVRLINCQQRGCALGTAIVEDTLIDGFKTNGQFDCWGSVFKHVTLSGKIGRVMISPCVATATATVQEQRSFDEANRVYYENVDWALDITAAEFEGCEIQGVPARKIKRDTETQGIITREVAIRGEWRQLDLSKTFWATSIQFFLDRGDEAYVLVAPKRHRKFKDLFDALNRLRQAGMVEPD